MQPYDIDSSPDISSILKYIYEIWCNEDIEKYNFIVAWLSDFIKNPNNKMPTGIVLFFPNIKYKSILTKQLGQKLGYIDDVIFFNGFDSEIKKNYNFFSLFDAHQIDNQSISGFIHLFKEKRNVRYLFTSNHGWKPPTAFCKAMKWALFTITSSNLDNSEYIENILQVINKEANINDFCKYLKGLQIDFDPLKIPSTCVL